MKRIELGKTGISVSQLGLGTLTIGPFQLNLPFNEGAQVICEAVKSGINLIDTAKVYLTYPYIKRALAKLSPEEKAGLCIVSRSYDYTYQGMKASFEEALSQMGLDKISIFMLHEVESEKIIAGHSDAIKFLKDSKSSGKLQATGISTHYIAAVLAASENPDIDVIFAILNKDGIGIMDGTAGDMEAALLKAHQNGKGILIMKALGGGHLYNRAKEALEFARDLPFPACTVLGVQDAAEINYAISVFNNEDTPDKIEKKERKLFIEPWCCACGCCIETCPFEALYIKDGRAEVDQTKCMLCSYCARSCSGFCIKIV